MYLSPHLRVTNNKTNITWLIKNYKQCQQRAHQLSKHFENYQKHKDAHNNRNHNKQKSMQVLFKSCQLPLHLLH